jgi:glycosyltransferase involved in cell wall biosynthesis
MDKYLTCIIVTRNEEQNIRNCVESVINNTATIKAVEILLIDSSSTDNSVEISKQYPISIAKLREDWVLSPAAGKYIGVLFSTAKYILTIDGDMELLPGWLNDVLSFLEGNSDVAGVVGKQYDINPDTKEKELMPSFTKYKEKREISFLSGSSIFRREYLEKAGNFHPFLRSEEEAEVSYRLRKLGYKLYFLPFDSILHYRIFYRKGLKETFRRLNGKLWEGMGDMFSLGIRKRYLSLVWGRFNLYFMYFLFVFISVICTVYFIAVKNISYACIVFSSLPAFVIFMCLKKKSMKYGVLSILNLTLITINVLSGILRKIPDISTYPRDAIWIKNV